MLQVLNFCIAACGGVFLLSLFGRTDLVTFVSEPIAAVQPESYRQKHRSLGAVRTLRSNRMKIGSHYA